MRTILSNLDWMLFNSLLAVFPVYWGYAFVAAKNRYLKACFGLLWLLFVPNTIYVLTDLLHLPNQLPKVSKSDLPFLYLEFFVFEIVGLITFVLAMYPIEQFLQKKHNKRYIFISELFIVFLNFLISFGVIMGRFQRTNSWYIFTDPQRVIDDVVKTIQSPEYMIFIGIFGVICNCLYFLFRKPIQAAASFLYKDHRLKKKN